MPSATHSLTALLAAALLATASPLAAQTSPQTPPLTTAEPSGRILRRETAPGLYEIVYSQAQNAVFVASAGGRGEGSAPASILRLDPVTLDIQAEIALPGKGFGLALDDQAGRLYVGDTTAASIAVIDLATNSVTGTVQLAEKVENEKGEMAYPHGLRELVLDPARNRLYAPGLGFRDSVLYVVDTEELAVAAVLPDFGAAATGIQFDAGHDRLYVSNLQGELHILDAAGPERLARVATSGDQLLNLALDAAGDRIFATDQGNDWITGVTPDYVPGYVVKGEGNQVLVLNAADGATLQVLPTGADPVAPLFDAARSRLYVSNREGSSITVFDTETYALLETIALPVHPNSMALDPVNNALFVTVKNPPGQGGDESVVRIEF